MNYKKYAKILVESEKTEKDFSDFFDNFIKFLKEKGELKYLPSIFSGVEKILREESADKKTKIVLKDKSFFEKYSKEIKEFSENFNLENMEIEENKNIIGGYILKNKKYKVDNSHKNRLLTLYNKIIK
jgi:F0F1-type ATP synthase delta subunit